MVATLSVCLDSGYPITSEAGRVNKGLMDSQAVYWTILVTCHPASLEIKKKTNIIAVFAK